MSLPFAVFTFVDNNGNKSRVRVWLGPGVSATLAPGSILAQLAAAFQGLSDAFLSQIDLVQEVTYDGPGIPSATSDVYTRVLLFFSDGGRAGTVSIPSPGELPYDEDGPYRAIRLSRDNLLLLGVLAQYEDCATGTVFPDGGSFPTTYVVGGRARARL